MRIDAHGVQDEIDPGLLGEHILYDGEVRVRFDADAHRYTVQDVRLGEDWIVRPSVTQVLSIIDKSKMLVPWAARCSYEKFRELLLPGCSYTEEELEHFGCQIRGAHKAILNRAGDVGHQTHSWIQSYLEARACRRAWPVPPTDSQVRSCCSAARTWIKEVDVQPMMIERILYSRRHRVIGTTDLGAALNINGRTAICDWKSSNSLHDTYKLQLAAYRVMWHEMTGIWLDDRWLIRLDKTDSSFEPVCLPTNEADRDAKLFFSLAQALSVVLDSGLDLS